MPHSTSVLLNRLLARGKFRHVQVLLKLAELGSVQRTADAIGMTQSSVTQTLAYLEDLLGIPLFQRHARGVRPTPACTQLRPVARQLLLGVSEGAEVIATHALRGRGLVRLAASAAATNGLLEQAIPLFNGRFPNMQVFLRDAEGEDQLLAIARDEVDLVVCRRPPVVPEGWQFEPLLEDRFGVFCRATHPLAGSRKLAWARLIDEPWLLPPAGSPGRERFDELTSHLSRRPARHPLVTRSPLMMWWMLRQVDVLSFLPISFVRPLLDAAELVELKVGSVVLIEALGLLRPQALVGDGTVAFAGFLRELFAPA